MKVLCPLDGSERSLSAAARAREILPDADFTLFAVQTGGFDNAAEDVVEEFEDDTSDEVFPTEASCKDMLKDARKTIGQARLKVGHGNYVKAIIEESEEHDVLVMHALGKSQLKENLRLSSTEKLARKVNIHVLLVADEESEE